MLREIGLGTLLLIILTIMVGVAVLTTADFGPFAVNSIGVTSETALVWGQNAEMAVDEAEETNGEAETAESADGEDEADSAEATEESGE